MIGNDVVDLALAKKESNWQRTGFLDKILTASEKQLVNNSKIPFETVWLLWSMKESAYKIHNRSTGIRMFNPLKFECVNIKIVGQQYFGSVMIADQRFYTKSIVSEDYIETVASDSHKNLRNIKVIGNGASITKFNNLPFFWVNNTWVPVSISHHGRFNKIVSLVNS